MPEKPEVLTVARSLEPRLIGKEITDCKVYWDHIIAEPSVASFVKEVRGEKFESITTRGKWLVFFLSTKALLIHLRMEGKFFFRKIGEVRGKHEHVVFTLNNEEEFRFADVRKFGKMHLVEKDKVYQVLPLSSLGLQGIICIRNCILKIFLLRHLYLIKQLLPELEIFMTMKFCFLATSIHLESQKILQLMSVKVLLTILKS